MDMIAKIEMMMLINIFIQFNTNYIGHEGQVKDKDCLKWFWLYHGKTQKDWYCAFYLNWFFMF